MAPEQVHFKFNVAFVQIQLATTIYGLSETQRSLEQLQDAATGLESAIAALDELAAHPQTPYPKQDVEQRANMARNTQRKQLERAIASQKEYEEKNKEKLAAALELRQAALKKREEEKQKAAEAERERQEKIRKEREAIAARDRELAEARHREQQAKEEAEMTTDGETGEKIKRKRKAAGGGGGKSGESRGAKGARSSRKKKPTTDDDQSDVEDSEAEQRQPKKIRRLTQNKKVDNTKYKSAEIVVDSDEDEEEYDALDRAERKLDDSRLSTPDSDLGEPAGGRQSDEEDRMDVDKSGGGDGDDDDDATNSRPKRSRRGGRVLDESDDEDEDGTPAEKGTIAADTKMGDAEEDEE